MIYVSMNSKTVEHIDAADAKKIFLLHAVLPVAAIEFMSDRAVILGIHIKVCVEKIEIHAYHVHAPHMAIDRTAGTKPQESSAGHPHREPAQ